MDDNPLGDTRLNAQSSTKADNCKVVALGKIAHVLETEIGSSKTDEFYPVNSRRLLEDSESRKLRIKSRTQASIIQCEVNPSGRSRIVL